MAIRYYDEALVTKIQKWIPDNKMKVLSPEEVAEMFSQRAHMSNDKPITLPFVALSRDTNITILSATKQPLSYDGKHVGIVESKVAQLNAIPIGITYQLDIYTKKAVEGDEYLRNFIFQFINYPKLKIEIPYNGSKIEHTASIRLESTVSDNSDIPQRLFVDQFTRWTIRFSLQDAYLFSIPLKQPAQVVSDDDSEGSANANPVLEIQDDCGIHKENI